MNNDVSRKDQEYNFMIAVLESLRNIEGSLKSMEIRLNEIEEHNSNIKSDISYIEEYVQHLSFDVCNLGSLGGVDGDEED